MGSPLRPVGQFRLVKQHDKPTSLGSIHSIWAAGTGTGRHRASNEIHSGSGTQLRSDENAERKRG